MDEAWLDGVLPLPDHTLPHVITRAQAMQLGVGRDAVDHRVRSGRWRRVAPGVYVTGPLVSDRDRAVAALRHGGSRSVLSGAARLRLAAFRQKPCSEACARRTNCSLSTTLAHAEGAPCSVEPSPTSVRVLIRCRRRARDALLRRGRVPTFEQNAEILIAGRRLVADFLWRALRAVLEIDSVEYHLGPADHAATLRRDHLLQVAGYAVLHVAPSQLRDGPAFVALVRTWLDQLRWNRATSRPNQS